MDMAKRLDERDAAHKTEVDQLKGQIAELLDEKEERDVICLQRIYNF
jgi:hypothetical protein